MLPEFDVSPIHTRVVLFKLMRPLFSHPSHIATIVLSPVSSRLSCLLVYFPPYCILYTVKRFHKQTNYASYYRRVHIVLIGWPLNDLLMPSFLRKHHATSKQHPSHYKVTTHKNLLQEQRLDTYTGEPLADGNRLVMLPHQVLSSDATISRDAESKMAAKIVDIMRPFDGTAAK